MATKAIVGEKVGMTQVWDDQHRAVPVTVVRVSPARVVQVKTPEKEGYAALQVTWGTRRASTLSKPELGHFEKAGVAPGRAARRAAPRRRRRLRGRPGDRRSTSSRRASAIDATAISKGKGFAGGMKRHNFKGQGGGPRQPQAPPRARLDRRVRDARAACSRARGWPGAWAAARSRRPTSRSSRVDVERQLVLVKGAVPGPRGGVVVLRTSVKNPMAAGGAR